MRRHLFRPTLVAIFVLGFALRLWSARGGLWVDEAWSAVLVEGARSPAGIFLAINHDNNHHLNSLWMLLWGFDASPLALRSLSIASGTLTILIASAIGARRSALHALVAALLFAISPILVNYGSEARGYALMLLAAMMMIWVQCTLNGAADGRPRGAWIFGGLALVGLFAQLTMLFFIIAIATWVGWTLSRRMPLDAAIKSTVRLMLPAFGATLLAFGTIIGAAASSESGMHVGGYVPFSYKDWFHALSNVASTTLGLSAGGPWVALFLIASIAALVFRARGRPSPTRALQFIAILLFPLMFPLLQIGNSSMPRYYLLTAIAILLLMADFFAAALADRRTRVAAGAMLAALSVGCLHENLEQASLKRGDPSAAIDALKRHAPAGAAVLVDHIRPTAVLRVAAASAAYPLAIIDACPARGFVYVEFEPLARVTSAIARCGNNYELLITRRAGRLSGTDWALYSDAGPIPLLRGVRRPVVANGK